MSDYDLGGYLLGYFIATQADDLGIAIDHISEEFSERVRQHVLTLESETAKDAAVEKALHKAASGNFEKAGKLFREYLIAGAVAVKFIPIGIKKSMQASEFGRKGARQKKEEGEANSLAVLNAANEILGEWKAKQKPSARRLAQLIADKTLIPVETVRTHLKKSREDKKLG